MQLYQGVNSSKHIHARILFQLNFWNCWAFVELVKYIFNVATGYLRKYCVIQSKEQCHCMFSNVALNKHYKRQSDFSMNRK